MTSKPRSLAGGQFANMTVEERDQLKRELRAARDSEWVQRVARGAPPLSEEQLIELAAALKPGIRRRTP